MSKCACLLLSAVQGHTCTRTHAHAHTRTHTHTHAHAHTRTHTHTHAHTHTEVPASVLSKVTHAIQLANAGKTSLFKASQLLEFTSSSYKYARFASHDNFDLKRESKRLLCEYDKTFRQLVDCRIRTDMGGAETQQEECFRQLGEMPGLVSRLLS